MRRICTALLVIGILALPAAAEPGIAGQYPGDVGIENDPRVVLTEDFEIGTLEDLKNRWSDVKNLAGMSFTSDRPVASTGARSLQLTALGGSNSGGHLYKPLPSGQDRIYFRYYIKYVSGHSYGHSGGWVGGYNPVTNWPLGGAGSRPAGDDRFSISSEPVTADLRYDFYAYWMRMRGAGGAFWGNDLINDSGLRTPVDRWTCIEVMVKLNDPIDSVNGELALWVDGNHVTHLGPGFPKGNWIGDSFHQDPGGAPFEGFQWRDDPNLTVNWIWLQHYVTGEIPGGVSPVSFDDVVVATDYIGPIFGNEVPLAPPAPPVLLEP